MKVDAGHKHVRIFILSMNLDSGRHREETIDQILKVLREEVLGVDIEVEQPLDLEVIYLAAARRLRLLKQITLRLHHRFVSWSALE